MQLENNEILRAALDTAERFADRELRKKASELDKYPYVDYALHIIDGAAQAGILLLTAPEELGGAGMPAEFWALVLEKISYVEAGFAAGLMAHAMAFQAVLKHGSTESLNSVIEQAPMAYPIYHQYDDTDRLPRVVETGKGPAFSGTALRVANAPVAAHAVIIALKNDAPGLFLVRIPPKKNPAPIEMLGLRACAVGDLSLENVAPEETVQLAEGIESIKTLHRGFYGCATALLLSSLKASLDYAIQYGMERFQGGKIIAQHSQLQNMYAQMAIECLALRQSWLRGLENSQDHDANLAVKILAARLAVRATIDGVQLLGGYGYTMEYPQERRMRDARQATELLGSPIRQQLSFIQGRLSNVQ